MKEIAQNLPYNIKEIQEKHKDLYKKLKLAFKNPHIEKQIMKIREEFNIPAYGIKYSGFSSKDSKNEKQRKYKNFLILNSLYSDNKTLKELRLKVKSRKVPYQRKITALRKNLGLPIRFQNDLAYSVVLHNRFPSISSCLSPCIIRVFDDNGEKRVFIEIFGDTKRQHLLKAWNYIENLIKEYNLTGSQLFRYSNYYADMLLSQGGDISLIEKDKKEGLVYDEIAIRKKRFRDFKKRYTYSN